VRPDLQPPAHEVQARPVAAAPASEPPLDEDTQKFIAQSLTDVDLFANYGLTQKAIGLLEAILRRAPRHTPTLEKLLDFVLGAGDDRRTAELAAKLEQIHRQRGDARSSERFGELRRRFQRAAGLTDQELAGPAEPPSVQQAEVRSEEALPAIAEPALSEFTIDEVPVEAAEVSASQAAPSQAQEIHEVDLSDEWASMLEESHPAEVPGKAPVAPAEPAPEFELTAEAPAEEHPGPEEPEEFVISEEPASALSSEAPASLELGAPAEAVAAEEETLPFAEISRDVSQSSEPAAEAHEVAYEPPSLEELAVPPAAEVEHPPVNLPAEAPKVPEPEFELDQDYELVLDPEPLVPAYDQKPPDTPIVVPEPEPVVQEAAPVSPASGFASDQFLSDLAKEIDQLGMDKLSPEFSQPAAEDAAARNAARIAEKAATPGDAGPLKEVFDEFRAELGEMGDEEEDLETHYNLGMAFREMGLLEEAISEFQKVAKASERGRPFRYSMQCCTLLGLAFMEKGQPSIAAMWYERALRLPDIDPDGELALRYDLGVAQEAAGELDAARKSFFQVYAVNIDYRDVGERIAALQKPAR
jgi:hypothetical protein